MSGHTRDIVDALSKCGVSLDTAQASIFTSNYDSVDVVTSKSGGRVTGHLISRLHGSIISKQLIGMNGTSFQEVQRRRSRIREGLGGAGVLIVIPRSARFCFFLLVCSAIWRNKGFQRGVLRGV